MRSTILSATSCLFIGKARLDQRLSALEAGFQRCKNVQLVLQRVVVILSLVPFAGGAIATGVAGADQIWDGMQITNFLESLLSVGRRCALVGN